MRAAPAVPVGQSVIPLYCMLTQYVQLQMPESIPVLMYALDRNPGANVMLEGTPAFIKSAVGLSRIKLQRANKGRISLAKPEAHASRASKNLCCAFFQCATGARVAESLTKVRHGQVNSLDRRKADNQAPQLKQRASIMQHMQWCPSCLGHLLLLAGARTDA